MKTLLTLLTLLLLALPLQAQQLRIVHVGGYKAVSPEEVFEIYKRASWYFSQINVKFRMKYIPIDYNPCIYKHSLVSREAELDCFKSLTTGGRRRVLTYWMTPPFISVDEPGGPQTAWIAGMAAGIGCKIATGNASERQLYQGEEGPSRLDHSATALAHETLHCLRATHYDFRPNLMNKEANKFTDQFKGRLPVLRVTRRQVQRSFVRSRRVG